MVYLIGNVAEWVIDHRSASFPSEGNQGPSRLSEEYFAEFLTKTERKESKNTQNLLLDRCYLLFEEYLQERNRFNIS